MHSPRVGVIASRSEADGNYVLPATYAGRVSSAGAIPLLIPYLPVEQIPEILGWVDALLFLGGGDVEPERLGLGADPAVRRIDLARDAFEFAVWDAALPSELPILGICRGAQCMNIAAGGDLIMDLPRDRPGSGNHDVGMTEFSHAVQVSDGTRLRRILGADTAQVNSAHHQAIGEVAPGFAVSAVAPDGVVECIEAIDGPFRMGIQWHPEALPAGAPLGADIFRAFVEAIAW